MRRKKFIIRMIKLGLVLALISACTPTSTPTTVPIDTPTSSEVTSAPTQAIGIPLWPTQEPASISKLGEVITPENASKLTQLDYRGLGAISGIAWSPDGAQIAIASGSGIYLVDTTTYEEKQISASSSTTVAYSPDGSRLASAEGSSIKIWDMNSGQVIQMLTGHTDMIYSVAFSPDGEMIVSGSQDETVRLWDVASGQELSKQPGTGTFVYQVAFLPDGKRVASAAYEKKIVIWDASNEELRPIATYAGVLMAFSPNGEILATGSYDEPVRLWDIDGGKELSSFAGNTKAIQALAFSPDGKILVVVTDDTSINLWDISTKELLRTLKGHEEYVSSIAFSPDGGKLASGSAKTIKVWDIASGQELHTLTGQTKISSGDGQGILDGFGASGGPVAFSPFGDVLAAADYEGPIKLYDVPTGKLQAQIETDIGFINSIAFSPDGKLLAAGGGHYEPIHVGAQAWNLDTLEQILKLDFTAPVREVAFSPDSSLLATAWGESSWGCGNGSLKLWELTTGEVVSEFKLIGKNIPGGFGSDSEIGTIEGVAFSPDGTLLAGINSCGNAGMWKIEDQTELTTLIGATGYGYAVAFSPDGKLLATSGSANNTDGTADLRLWNVSTGELLYALEGHTRAVRRLAFNPDGRILASASFDGTVILWDVDTGKGLATINAPTTSDVAFNPDGTMLATGGDVVRLWGVPAPEIPTLVETIGYGYANDTAWSPDGQTLAVGTSAGVALYNTSNLQAPTAWHASAVGIITSLAFDPDSQLLAIAGWEGLALWNVVTYQEQVLQAEADTFGVAFSPDGRLLAADSYKNDVQIWDIVTGKPVISLKSGIKGILEVLVFSPDGKILASASSNRTEGHSDGVVRLWEVSTGKLLTTLGDDSKSLAGVAFSPDGKTLATGGPDTSVSIWDITSGKLLKKLEGHTGDVISVAFSPDGLRLASLDISNENQVHVWDVSTGRSLSTLDGCTRTDFANQGKINFSPDGTKLSSACEGAGVMVWDIATRKVQQISQGYGYGVTDIAFSPDGKLLAIGHSRIWDLEQPSDIILWNVETKTEYGRMAGHQGIVNKVAFNPERAQLASVGFDGKARLWDINTGESVIIREGDPITGGSLEYYGTTLKRLPISSLAYSPDGAMLAIGGGEVFGFGQGWLELYDTATGKKIAALKPNCMACGMLDVSDIAFSPDGTLLVTSNDEAVTRFWDVATRQESGLSGEINHAGLLAFSPDGKILATGLQLWNMKTGDKLTELAVGIDTVDSTAFSPDGKLLAMGGEKRVVIWDLTTDKQLAQMEYGDFLVCAFSPDGRLLAIGDATGVIQLWRMPGQ